MDTATANGISPERFAKLMAKAIDSTKRKKPTLLALKKNWESM